MSNDHSGRRPFRHSLNFSLLRSSSSPESARSGGAPTPNVRVFGNESRTSFLSATSNSYTAKAVDLEELADSESSRDDISAEIHTDQAEKDAESIYSVIQDYSAKRLTFRFSEIFHEEEGHMQAGGSKEEKSDKVAFKGEIEEAEGKNVKKGKRQGFFVGSNRSGAGSNPDRGILKTSKKGQQKGLQPQTKAETNVETKAPSTTVFSSSFSGPPAASGGLTGPFERPELPATPRSSASHERKSLGSPPSFSVSLSSGELLTQLEPKELVQTPAPSSAQTSAQTLAQTPAQTPAQTAHNQAKDRALEKAPLGSAYAVYNTDSLSAGIDSSSELPITLYTVQDHASPASRWSVYEAQKNKASVSQQVNVPRPVYVGLVDGTNSARRVSVSTKSTPNHQSVQDSVYNSFHNSFQNSFQNMFPNSISKPLKSGEFPKNLGIGFLDEGAESPQSFQNFYDSPKRSSQGSKRSSKGSKRSSSGSKQSKDSKQSKRWRNSGVNSPEPRRVVAQNQTSPLEALNLNDSSDLLSLPSSMVREPHEKSDLSQDMFGGNDSIFANQYGSPVPSYDREKWADVEENPYLGAHYSWSRWALVMCSALLAVPVFFLVALGVFDNGGFSRSGFASKNGLSRRYNRCYSRSQKIASAVLGLIWVAIVFSMIAVGFGVGLRPR